MADVQRLRVLIVGSCVSRDTFVFLDPARFELVGYVARQSLASGFGPATTPKVPTAELTSRFQRRMIEGDAASDLPQRVEAAAPGIDLVLWDIVDERLGVHLHPDGGITTDTVESRTLGAAPHAERGEQVVRTARHVAFGSDEHFGLFVTALPAWRATLAEPGLLDRTVLVAPPWATLATDGELSVASFGLDARTGNDLSRRYLDAAVEALGIPVVGQDMLQDGTAGEGPQVRSAADHQWGPAAFHYDDATYSHLAHSIVGIARERSRPRGWAPTDEGVRVPTALERDPSLRHVIEPSVSLAPGAEGELTATLTAPPVRAWAFHLYRDGTRVATTAWENRSTVSFPVRGPGVYRCRAYLLTSEGERRPVVSAPLRVA